MEKKGEPREANTWKVGSYDEMLFGQTKLASKGMQDINIVLSLTVFNQNRNRVIFRSPTCLTVVTTRVIQTLSL